MSVTLTEQEARSQPEAWARTLAALADHSEWRSLLREHPVDVIGCGTSYYMALSAARLIEAVSSHLARAMAGSDYRPRGGRTPIFITRSGTTTEIIAAMRMARASGLSPCLVTNDPASPAAALADLVLAQPWADEHSVVQTRSATSNVLALRALLAPEGSLASLPDALAAALAAAHPEDAVGYDHFVFLGADWVYGLACEAMLKMQESALARSEAYLPLEYRHGPLSCAGPRTRVHLFHDGQDTLARLVEDIRATGATVLTHDIDPLLVLPLIHLEAVQVSLSKGLNPDQPVHLTRSVLLS